MPRAQSFSARIYAAPGYCEGYNAGSKAAHLRRSDTNPYMPQDLRHLGWMDAFYDAWSARRVEISRASEQREIGETKALNETVSPPAGRITN